MSQHTFPGTGQIFIDSEKLNAGELASFQHIYRLFFNEFVEAAQLILVDKDEAPNLLKHAFIRCWYRSDEYTSLYSLLLRLGYIVRRQCEDCNKSNGFRSAHHIRVMEMILSGTGSGKKNPDKMLPNLQHLTATELGKAREIFMWFYARQKNVQDIANGMRLNVEYVQDKLDLAISILHLLLSDKM